MALFSKKTESKEETKYEVSNSGSVSIPKIPTVLVQPRISEKASKMAGLNKYVFNVKLSANKVEVKKAVEAAYKVKVTQVNMVKTLGKNKNFGQRTGRTSDSKKAIVTLKKGDSIKGLTDVV